MDLHFLAAEEPITKTYELNTRGEVVKHPYPFVYRVTSIEEQCPTLRDMARLLQDHAKKGNTLLKGRLSRPLVQESRAGTTDADQSTDWICLDLDGIDNYQSVDLFLDDIGCGGVDYVLQWSSSMGIENNSGFRCHIFMKLDKATHPQLLKHWLMGINLSTASLRSQCKLTKTGNALLWPLDITTCQNDKLIYIAPPTLGPGIVDPFPGVQRISYHKRSRAELTLPRTIQGRDALRTQSDERIAELRKEAGLPARKTTKYRRAGDIEFMVAPDTAVVTGIKEERGFVYFNLNGGDSWAYYHPEDAPNFIFNFKGEPTYRTEDLLPDYWAKLRQKSASYTPNRQGLIHLAFRDFRTANYYNGSFNTQTNELVLAMAKSESQLRQYMTQHGCPLGEYVPDWDIVWNPHNPLIVDTNAKELNLYNPSEYYKAGTFPNPVTAPPTIHKVVSHVLGHDQATIDHFYNWLAVIAQNLAPTGTAWVLQGVQGTGKGVLFHQILTPIFGDENVVAKRMEELESEFTGFMENKFIVFIDEIESGRSLYHSKVTAKLKNLIVEPMISIRKMYHPPYMAKNYSNMIFASNKPAAVEVAPDDRRFNVGCYQERSIQLTSQEVDVLIPSELLDFYGFLMNYPANSNVARKPLISEARSTLINIGLSSIEDVIAHIKAGDIEFLWDNLPATASEVSPLKEIKLRPYKALLKRILHDLPAVLSRDDLYTILEWCVGGMPDTPHKFTSMLKHYRITMSQVWNGSKNVRGIPVTWNYEQGWLDETRQNIDF